MRLRSVARKLSYVALGAAGMYAVMRAPPVPNPLFLDVMDGTSDEPRRRAVLTFVPTSPHADHVPADPAKLFAAFEGSRRGEPAVRCSDDGMDVVEIAPDYRAVHRSFMDCMLEDQSQLMRSARIVPVMHDNVTTGVRIFGVTPGTPLFKLGFRNGDEVRDVNNMEIIRPESALTAYSRLRLEPNLSAGLIRNGVFVRLRFVIC